MLKSNIKYWRDKEGRTNKWLAQQLGVREETISRWINNKGTPPIETLFKLAHILKCKIDDLFEYKP